MLKEKSEEKDYLYILKNLRKEDKEEVQAVWGDTWEENLLRSIKKYNVLVVIGKNMRGDKVPIAMGGFVCLFEKHSDIACVWMLTTTDADKNKILLMKEIDKQIKEAGQKYKILYNYIYKSNKEAKKWLNKLGFNFNKPKPEGMELKEGFEFFYKLTK